jgi:hypothetical protein
MKDNTIYDSERSAVEKSYWNEMDEDCSRHHHHQPINAHCWGTGLPYGLPTRRTGHNPSREPSADLWMEDYSMHAIT